MTTEPKYPEIHVQLSGEDGNSMFIVGRARSAARQAGLPSSELDGYSREAMSGDYDHVLQTTMKWFSTS
jgi:hypothetical protein